MKLVTYVCRSLPRPGAVLDGDRVVDLNRAYCALLRSRGESQSTARAEAMVPAGLSDLLRLGDEGMQAARAAVEWVEGYIGDHSAEASDAGILFSVDDPGFRLKAPISSPGKVLAVGLNYRDHAEESKVEIPKRPVVFVKVSSCINDPSSPIYFPKVSDTIDYEGELCVVIGKAGRHVSADQALDHVAGFMIGNDVSVREWQFHSNTWIMGKGFDTHGPTGPWLVTPDEVGDAGALSIKTWVSGDLRQNSNTRNLIFPIPAIIEYVSQAFTLHPGDIIFTGTPGGVGAAMDPRKFLKVGDVVRIEIERLGVLENNVVPEP